MELKEYIIPLRKWWWLLLLATVVAAASSYLAARQQPDFYEARATLMIGQAIDNPNPSGAEFWLTQQLAQTYAEIAVRDPVRNATMETLGLTWLPEFSVKAVLDTQLIDVSVVDSSQVRAQAVANELARQLILQSPTSPEQDDQSRMLFISQQLDNLERNITETENEISSKQAQLATLLSAREIADVQNEINGLQGKLNTLQTNYANLLANTRGGAINTLTLISPAALPTTTVGPSATTTVLVAAVIGFTLAAGAAYLIEYLNDTIETQDDLDKAIEVPTLAGIARIQDTEEEGKLIALSKPRSPTSEAYRVLRTGIQFSSVDNPEQARLMITSANPAEGKSLTVANLAIVMAQAGHRVLVVDADLRRPTQHKIFHISQNKGLTSLLLDIRLSEGASEAYASMKRVIQPSAVEGLHLLASGPIPPNPSELLGSAKMRKSMELLSKQYDYVLVDSPPVLAVTDAVVLSSITDGVLLVVDAGKTRSGQLQQAADQLNSSSATILGVVLNRLTPKSDGYYTYYYYRHSYYLDTLDDSDGDGPASNGRRTGSWRRKRRSSVAQEVN